MNYEGGWSVLSANQKRVLRVFARTWTATLEEVRASSPWWNQGVQWLRRKGYVVFTNDGGYALTKKGCAEMAGVV